MVSLATAKPSSQERNIPPACRAAEHSPQPSFPLHLSARISIASCTASINLNAMQRTLRDNPVANYEALDAAIAPSIAMLDDVIAKNVPELELLAARAEADLYTSVAVRTRNTEPMTEDRAAVEALIAPALARADERFARVLAIADQHPELASDPIVEDAVDASRMALGR
jgi:hypothetical protein